MSRKWVAHELLETTELLRKLAADIDLHAIYIQNCSNPKARRLNDMTIGTIILNADKEFMFGMLWANECVDPIYI
ncbi:hypothetical protein [Ammoniphilus sp. 3BR4]|uniref:hypothetical protein n=1 Tax=Ammoniphilus sp. 3BR4 TaxID=3158265 RepID=UPI00346696DC